VPERRKGVTTGRTNERTDSKNPNIPQSLFGGGIQILSKINFRNLKKSRYLVKVPFSPLIPFHIKKNPNHLPSKKISGINKI
jgi:hypothetical protein